MSIEWKEKEWWADCRAGDSGYNHFGSDGWKKNFPKINNSLTCSLFDDFFKHGLHVDRGFAPSVNITRLEDKYAIGTNAYIYRTNNLTRKGGKERNADDSIAFFLDGDEIKRLAVPDDEESLEKYSDNFWNRICGNRKPIQIPFSDEKRTANDIDIEFSKALFDLCNTVSDINELLDNIKIPIKDRWNNKVSRKSIVYNIK